VNDQIALALHQRLETVEKATERLVDADKKTEWLVGYTAAIENALIVSLPKCSLGLPGPTYSAAHVQVCRRCAALAALEEFGDKPLPGGGG
jgi:hypothetical protein